MNGCLHVSRTSWKQVLRDFQRVKKVSPQCDVCKTLRTGLWLCLSCESPLYVCPEHLLDHAHPLFCSVGQAVLYCTACGVSMPEESVPQVSAVIEWATSVRVCGQAGLKNLGKTCYMNSALQCLNHIPALSRYFIEVYPQYCAAVQPEYFS